MKRARWATLSVLVCVASTATAGDDGYRDEIERWRQKREADLKADDGWLTVSGLYWLKPGETKIGSDPQRRPVAGPGPGVARDAHARPRPGRLPGGSGR